MLVDCGCALSLAARCNWNVAASNEWEHLRCCVVPGCACFLNGTDQLSAVSRKICLYYVALICRLNREANCCSGLSDYCVALHVYLRSRTADTRFAGYAAIFGHVQRNCAV